MLPGLSLTLAGFIAGLCLWLLSSAGGSSSSPTLPPGGALDETEVARLHEIRDRTAAVRGLEVIGEVSERYLSRDDLGAYIDTAYSQIDAADRRQLQTMQAVMRLLRMIEPDDDLLDILVAGNSLGVAGFYDYEEKRLVIVADGLTGSLDEESTLAHEYTHALQDQHFGLQRYIESFDTEGTEYSTTLSCVFEGDASLTQVHYMQEVYGPRWPFLLLAEYADNSELESLLAEIQEAVPAALIRYLSFNYSECAAFVTHIWEAGGWDAVNALYDNPPSTTEQVLHPERYLAGETALEVPMPSLTPGLGWRLADSLVFGEFDVYNYLATALRISVARQTAEGWGGGRMNLYTLGGGEAMQVLLHIGLCWDDAEAFGRFELGLNNALQGLDYESRALDGGVWSWSSPGEYGRAVWDADALRADLLFATDEAALGRALSVLTAVE